MRDDLRDELLVGAMASAHVRGGVGGDSSFRILAISVAEKC